VQKAWSHQNDIVYMGSDGLYLTGWLAISTLWKNVAAMKLAAKLPQATNIVLLAIIWYQHMH